MTGNLTGEGRSMPGDILATINQFRAGRLRLSAFLDRTWAQIHDLSPKAQVDVAALEERWTDIEIVYAQASAAQQPTLDDNQARDVERAMDDLAAALDRSR